VLLYTHHRTGQSLMVRGIRLVTGSRYVHCAVVQDFGYTKLVLEQLGERTFTDLRLYRDDAGEHIYVARPAFDPPKPPRGAFFQKIAYGYLGIVDCLINHAICRLSWGKWVYRPMLGRLTPRNIICSTLVAQVLDLSRNTTWCKCPAVVEPDDYYNHRESFSFLGEVDWTQ